MKKSSIFLVFSVLLLGTSCEEVIQLDLDTSAQRVVAEANLNATEGRCTVLLSKSGGFYESNTFEKIPGASIEVLTSNGNSILLLEQGNGEYSAENIALMPGATAQLHITLTDGKMIEAGPVLTPSPVVLEALMVEKNTGNAGPGGGGNERYSLSAKWKDLAGEDNYYRLKIYKNGQFQSNLYLLADDRLGDGLDILRPIVRESYALGDTLRVELLSVSKGYYDYFTDLANSDGRGFSSPTPYNPQSNWSGDAMGCFGIWSVSEKTILVK